MLVFLFLVHLHDCRVPNGLVAGPTLLDELFVGLPSNVKAVAILTPLDEIFVGLSLDVDAIAILITLDVALVGLLPNVRQLQPLHLFW